MDSQLYGVDSNLELAATEELTLGSTASLHCFSNCLHHLLLNVVTRLSAGASTRHIAFVRSIVHLIELLNLQLPLRIIENALFYCSSRLNL